MISLREILLSRAVINKLECASFEMKNIKVLNVHYCATIYRWYLNWVSNKDNDLEIYDERRAMVSRVGVHPRIQRFPLPVRIFWL